MLSATKARSCNRNNGSGLLHSWRFGSRFGNLGDIDPALDAKAVPELPRYMVYEEDDSIRHFVECFIGREGDTQVSLLSDLQKVSGFVSPFLDTALGHMGRAALLFWREVRGMVLCSLTPFNPIFCGLIESEGNGHQSAIT